MSRMAGSVSLFFHPLPDASRRHAVRRADVQPGELAGSGPDQPRPTAGPASQRILKLSRPVWLEPETALALIFALKTFAASLLALLIAFWAGLDDPRWAFLTVFVVSQPDRGLVLAKSFYRILGTIAGLLVTVALVFAFAQYGELFLASLAIWIFFCNFAAQARRNFASYGFQLAGYTVAIVGLPAALNPSGAYPLVVARGTEILLGNGCAVLVSRLLLVRELSPKLLASARSLADRSGRFAALVRDAGHDDQRAFAERAGLAEDYLRVAGLQNSAYFESADARIQVQRLRPVTDAAMQLCAKADVVASRRFGEMSGAGGDGALIEAMVRAEDDREIASARARLRESVAAFERGDAPAEQARACAPWSDPISAALVGLRAALAIGITGTIWFATAWPNGPTAVVVAAVLCSLLASLPNPRRLTVAAAAVVIMAAITSFATEFYLLPLAVDFPSMALALAPMVLTCSFLMAQPQIGTLGLVAIVYFAFSSNIDNVMSYDAAATLNASLSVLVGIGVALVLFAVFFPDTPGFACRRFRSQLAVHLRALIKARSGTTALQAYELALYEQLGSTLSRLKDEPAATRECVTSAGAALCLAQSITRLRTCLESDMLVPEIASEGARLLSRLSNALRNPSAGRLRRSEEEAQLLARKVLEAACNSPDADKSNGIVVACGALSADLSRGRPLLEEKSDAS